jgi:kynureninase
MRAVDRGFAEELDAADPLAGFRERFVFDDPPGTIYLDGNSLGRLPVAGRQRLHALIEQWGTQVVGGWDEWLDLPGRVGDRLGEVAIGAGAGQTLVCDSTTVNLFKLASGAVPAELDRDGVQLAVGCTYKYVNGGPGAPAFLYVRRELQDRLRTPIQGWFGQHDQFAMHRPYDPERDVRRFLAGTPPILQLAGVAAAVELLGEIGLDRIRAKNMALTELAVQLHDAWLAPLGFELASPRDPKRRGSAVCLRHRDAESITAELVRRHQVIVDFRGPDRVRFGLAAPYTGFVEVYDAMARVRELVRR